MYLKEKRGDDNFMCSWGAFLHYYNAGIFTCFPPTYDVYSVVIVITTGAGGWFGGISRGNGRNQPLAKFWICVTWDMNQL